MFAARGRQVTVLSFFVKLRYPARFPIAWRFSSACVYYSGSRLLYSGGSDPSWQTMRPELVVRPHTLKYYKEYSKLSDRSSPPHYSAANGGTEI